MSIGLSMCCTQKQVLRLEAPCTKNVFKTTETWLGKDADHQKALKFLGMEKPLLAYRDIMDCIFVELFPEWKRDCKRFYKTNKNPIRNILTRKEIAAYDLMLLKAVKVAYALFKENREKSWGWYKKHVWELAA